MRAWRRTAVLGLAAALMQVWPSDARAQAWLPPKGEGHVSVLYSNVFVEKHYLPTVRYDIGHITSNTCVTDLTYALTDRVAVSLSLPFVVSRYTGNQPHQAANPGRLDDGRWHGTFSDFRFNIRRGFRAGAYAVAPFTGTVIPSHDYQYWAHAAPGRRIRELVGGVTVARLLDGVAPGLLLQGQYSFAFAERILDVRPSHSNAELEIGYFVSPSLRLFLGGTGQLMHGGIDAFPRQISPVRLTPDEISHHDQIGRENHLNVAAGASFTLRDGIDVFGTFTKQVAGRNGHEVSRAVSVGISWRFRESSVSAGDLQRQPPGGGVTPPPAPNQ